MSKPVALYARVSTATQKTASQLRQLRKYARDRGSDNIEFVDKGVSGAKDSRPELDKMMEAARRREISAVVCTKLDRLARSTRHLCNLAAEFEALGVDLVILDMAVDTSTPMGKLLFSILAGVAEFERELIRDRTRAGMEAARANGKRIGRPPKLDKRQIERARRMKEKGQTIRHIASVLGVSHGTILTVLKAA
jgi:DNA invertase Pin-like site-specific DNA recombinase